MRPNNRKSKTTKNRQEVKQTEILGQILDLQKTQQHAFVERVPDVPRMKLKRNKVYTFARVNISLGQMTNSTTTPIGFSNAQSLAQIPNSSEFQNLFEQYRIVQCTWFFTPMFNGIAFPIYTWFDPDDNSVPIGTAEGAQSETLRISQSGQFVERTYQPQISHGSVATGGAQGGYSAPSPNTWLDTDANSVNVLYYGIKALIPANSNVSNSVPLYDVSCSVVIQCRIPK